MPYIEKETEPEKVKEPALNCFECSEQIKHESEIEELIEEFLKKLKKIKEAIETGHGWNSVIYHINEYEGRIK